MKKLIFLLVLLLAAPAFGADLLWDQPDEQIVLGWTIYYTDGTTNFNKTVTRTDLAQSGDSFRYIGFEDKLNIAYGVQYTMYVKAYNDVQESGPSNTVTHERSGYDPPADVLPPALPGASGSPGNLGVQ